MLEAVSFPAKEKKNFTYARKMNTAVRMAVVYHRPFNFINYGIIVLMKFFCDFGKYKDELKIDWKQTNQPSEPLTSGRGRIQLLNGQVNMETIIEETVQHTCERDAVFPLECRARQDLRGEARSVPFGVRTTAQDVYNAVALRYDPEVFGRLPFALVGPSIRKILRDERPPNPRTLQELQDSLIGVDGFTLNQRSFFRELQVGDFGANVIFASENFTRLIANGVTLQMDGTFKTVPRILNFTQLFTIMAVQDGIAYPIIQALMTRRTTEAYGQVMAFCTRMGNNVQRQGEAFSPGLVISDFEAAILRAAHLEWPESAIIGCWFHFCQALVRKSRAIGIFQFVRNNREARVLFRSYLVLPMLPSNRILEGANAVINEAARLNIREELIDLHDYIIETWIEGVGVNSLSVYGQAFRTNNLCENYHNQLRLVVGVQPDCWTFVRRLQVVEHSYAAVLIGADDGINVRRRRGDNYIMSGVQLRHARAELDAGILTPLTYLRRVGHQTDNILLAHFGEVNQEEDVLEHAEEIEAPPDFIGPLPLLEEPGNNVPQVARGVRNLNPRGRRGGRGAVNNIIQGGDENQDDPDDPPAWEAAVNELEAQPQVARGGVRRRRRANNRHVPYVNPRPVRGIVNERAEPPPPVAAEPGENIAEGIVNEHAEPPPPVAAEPGEIIAEEGPPGVAAEIHRLENLVRTLQNQLLCQICVTTPRNVMFRPCRHQVMCEQCFAAMRAAREDLLLDPEEFHNAHHTDRCPMCRQEIVEAVVIFM